MEKSNVKMSKVIEYLDTISMQYFNLHYKPLQTVEEYKNIEAPIKAIRSLNDLESLINMSLTPSLETIAYNIIVMSMSEKNFIHELVKSRLPDIDMSQHIAKDFVLAIKSSLYSLFQETLDALDRGDKKLGDLLKEYFDKRLSIIEEAFEEPTKFIARFKNEQIQLSEAITFANAIINKLELNFQYVPITPKDKMHYRLPYQPNYKIRMLSEKILQINIKDQKEDDCLPILADAYDYIFELTKTEENIMGFNNPTLEAFRKNISVLIDQMLHGVDVNKGELALRIEKLFDTYFKERLEVFLNYEYAHTNEEKY